MSSQVFGGQEVSGMLRQSFDLHYQINSQLIVSLFRVSWNLENGYDRVESQFSLDSILGQECDSLHFLGPSLGCLLATTTSTVIQIQPVSGSVSGNHINLHHLKPPAGILGDISRRVSSLVFGSMPTQAPEARLVGIAVIDSIDSYEKNIIILSARSLQKWYLCPGQPDKVVYECAVDKIIHEALVDYVWGRDRVGAQLQVWLVAIQNISGTNNIMILTAAVNPQVSQQLIYALVTFETGGPNPPATVSGFCMLKHSEYYQESAEALFLSQKFLLFGATAYIYTKNSVLCAPATSSVGEIDGGDRIEFSSAGDSILGVGRSTSCPLFFSANHGIVSISPSAHNQSLMNETVADDSVDLTNMTTFGTDMTDACAQLQAAFLQYNRKNVTQAQAILEDLYPSDEDNALDSSVCQLSTQLLDDTPGTDPRWAQAGQNASQNVSTTTSLIIANQIKDKITAYHYFITFLHKMGLWQRLGVCVVGDRKIHEHQALVDDSIRIVLSERGESPTGQLTNSDIFYRKISQIDSIVWGLIQAQEEVLSADVSPRDASLTIHNVNSIILSLLKSAKETKIASMLTRNVANETQIEYIPWVSSEGVNGFRQILVRQHKATVEIGLSRAEDGTVRGKLYNQIVELTDEMLMKGEQYNQAVSLAEKFCDFRTLVEICDKTNNQERLNQYMVQFGSQTLLSLGKLCGIARGTPSAEEVDKTLLLEEDLILYQEQLPEMVLSAHSISYDNMRVFSPKELIHLYIGEENTCANEFDIKKALDLLSWLEDPEEAKELRRLIWVRAITRNSWKHLDTDNPIESMSDTVFFRTVELAYTQGCDIKDLLTPAEDLLNSEELGDLIQDPTFQFLLKAGIRLRVVKLEIGKLKFSVEEEEGRRRRIEEEE
ncbi:Nuclear pore complex protein [Armadillidium nasatum]|uniref:Nuclear pore complex protein n=1 Tax=Armadillidium nasatum TaxID=96803 RepID=A0A5N5TAA9_9CRUS|nr:Nuclear pore complex protein [Armadillidium nasatum]